MKKNILFFALIMLLSSIYLSTFAINFDNSETPCLWVKQPCNR